MIGCQTFEFKNVAEAINNEHLTKISTN